MQKKIEKMGNLLNEKGGLRSVGYATKLLMRYKREHIQVPKWKIKEWDYYLMTNEEYAVALTLADNGYMGVVSVSLMDFTNRWYKTASKLKLFPLGKLRLPESSVSGDVIYRDKEIEIYFLNNGVQRKLKCKMKNFYKDKEFECQFILKDEPEDSMVIATPFNENSKAFYYNQKIIGMRAIGYAKFDNKLYKFKQKPSYGLLDWGRGVWTYKNTWYWGAASGKVDDNTFGFNIGYGFGNTENATENMIFYNGKAHKLDAVTFNIPKKGNHYEYMETWVFTSSDGRFEMTFTPILDRSDHQSIGVISSNQHQVFGRYTGFVLLDDGVKVEVKDLLGFAEKVYNKW